MMFIMIPSSTATRRAAGGMMVRFVFSVFYPFISYFNIFFGGGSFVHGAGPLYHPKTIFTNTNSMGILFREEQVNKPHKK
jgi:hypothetical protein